MKIKTVFKSQLYLMEMKMKCQARNNNKNLKLG